MEDEKKEVEEAPLEAQEVAEIEEEAPGEEAEEEPEEAEVEEGDGFLQPTADDPFGFKRKGMRL